MTELKARIDELNRLRERLRRDLWVGWQATAFAAGYESAQAHINQRTLELMAQLDLSEADVRIDPGFPGKDVER